MMMNPPHPGELLREDVIAELGLSVKETAERLGMSRVALSRVLNGRAAISPDLALRNQGFASHAHIQEIIQIKQYLKYKDNENTTHRFL